MSVAKGQIVPRKDTRGLRAKAWWLIRKNRVTTIPDLLQTLCTGGEGAAENNLRHWLAGLVAAEIVSRHRIEDGKLTSNGTYRYTLINDIGPLPPVVRAKTSVVFNPNNGSEINYGSR